MEPVVWVGCEGLVPYDAPIACVLARLARSMPMRVRRVHAMLLSFVCLLGACASTADQPQPNPEANQPRVLNAEQRQVIDLLKTYPRKTRWDQVRNELVTGGADAQAGLFNFLVRVELLSDDNQRIQRAEDEFGWALRTTRSAYALQLLVATCIPVRDAGVIAGPSGLRISAQRILEKTRGAEIVDGQTVIPIAQALLNADAGFQVDESDTTQKAEVRSQALMTRVNLLALAAAAGAQDDPAHLMRIKQSIARHQFADAWLIRARFYEVLANFEGDASKAQLEEGLNDADPNVRSIAAESLRRRRVRRTLTR